MPMRTVEKALIVCRSVTYAQQATHILNRAGLRAGSTRLPALLPDTGCGYAVRVKRQNLQEARDILSESGFNVTTVLCPQKDGSLGDCV